MLKLIRKYYSMAKVYRWKPYCAHYYADFHKLPSFTFGHFQYTVYPKPQGSFMCRIRFSFRATVNLRLF